MDDENIPTGEEIRDNDGAVSDPAEQEDATTTEGQGVDDEVDASVGDEQEDDFLDDDVEGEDPLTEEIVTAYVPVEGGHRVTRRRVRRRVEVEDVEETISEVLPAQAYAAPAGSHPAPVG